MLFLKRFRIRIFFFSMYIRKEALVSSQIEGTQCTLDDVTRFWMATVE